jgi:hypothetical protein
VDYTFGLKLVDGVTAPGKRATDTLKQVQAQAQKTQDVLAGKQMASLGKQFEKVGFAAARAQQNAAKAMDRSIIARERAIHRRVEKLQEHSLMGGLKEGSGMSKIMSGAFFGTMIAEGVFKIAEGMVEGAKKAVEVFAEGLKLAFEESAQQQTLRIGEKLSLGSGGAKDFREDVGRFSKLTGFDDDVIRGMLLPMRRAGMDQQASRTAFAAAGDVAAGEGRGNDSGRVKELLDAFTTIKLKGGVTEKMLPGLGVDVKEFYGSLGKQLGISAKAAKERSGEPGGIDPQMLLNTIYRGIEKKQGGQLGSGNIATSQSFATRFAKFKNLPNEFAKGLLDSSTFQKTSELLGGLIEKLDPESPAGQRIMAALESMFAHIGNLIGDPADAAESLADHVENAVGFAKQLVEVASSLADAFLPSLDTVEDMVLAFREMKAFGNADATMQVARDRGAINIKRIDREAEKYVRASTPDLYASKLKTNMLEESVNQTIGGFEGPIGLNPLALGAALHNAGVDTTTAQNDLRSSRGSSKKVEVTVPKIEMHFNGPVDEDTARKVAPEIHATATAALESAAQGSF